jgi:hypothetical protein
VILSRPPFLHRNFRKPRNLITLTLAQWQEILRAFYGLAEAPEKFLQILIPLHEINFRSVHDEQVRS